MILLCLLLIGCVVVCSSGCSYLIALFFPIYLVASVVETLGAVPFDTTSQVAQSYFLLASYFVIVFFSMCRLSILLLRSFLSFFFSSSRFVILFLSCSYRIILSFSHFIACFHISIHVSIFFPLYFILAFFIPSSRSLSHTSFHLFHQLFIYL